MTIGYLQLLLFHEKYIYILFTSVNYGDQNTPFLRWAPFSQQNVHGGER